MSYFFRLSIIPVYFHSDGKLVTKVTDHPDCQTINTCVQDHNFERELNDFRSECRQGNMQEFDLLTPDEFFNIYSKVQAIQNINFFNHTKQYLKNK